MAARSDIVKGRYSSYTLLNDVGHGGSARVFRAQDTATKREVAVKQLFGNGPEDRADWLREVDALTTLNNHHCPHVVQYLDHMQQHGRLFLVEEYAEHGSLLRRLRHDGPLSESAVCEVVFQILTALHRMSAWGVVHGDLKASNILVFDGLRVKLTDFALRSRRGEAAEQQQQQQHDGDEGNTNDTCDAAPRRSPSRLTTERNDDCGEVKEDALGERQPTTTTTSTAAGWTSSMDAASSESRSTAAPQRSRTTITTTAATAAAEAPPSSLIEFRGSVYWAAPEVLAGESRSTAASDVWAVACTAVELLTGSPPYFDRSLPNATHYVLKHYYAMMEEGAAAAAPAEVSDEAEKDAAAAKRGGKHGSTGDAGSCSSGSGAASPPRVLLPPLPDTLQLSDECVDFLRLCLQLRPTERPSAAALLQHPWFLGIVVPQLLRAARDGRVTTTGGNSSSNGASSGGDDDAVTGGGRFAVIERWVEANLLCGHEARCAAWLHSDALPLLVPVLTPRIMTPTYIGNVMRCFSHFAESSPPSLAALFLSRLGATELWSVEELTSACDADHLVSLFCCCCAAQDPQVAVFTPTHPAALRFVLSLEKAKVLECVAALHQLCVEPNEDEGAKPTEKDDQQPQLHQHQRCLRARERLLRDGGAAVLCQRVEAQCKTAFMNSAPPPLEWATVHRLLEVLATVEHLPGGRALLFGLPGEEGVGPAAAPIVTPRSDTAALPSSNANGAGHHGVGSTEAAAPLSNGSHLSGTPRSSPSPSSSALAGAASHSATPAVAASAAIMNAGAPATTAGANSTNVAVLNSIGSGVHNTSSSNFGLGSVSPGATTTTAEAAWAASLTWMLAIQEAARHGSDAAVLLLAHYIAAGAEGGRVDYVQKAGLSLAATLVLVASTPTAATSARCAAVASLPSLQATSLRAARYLRDPVRCIPLLAQTLQHAAAVPALVTALLSALRALTAEKQTLAAAASSAWMWAALVALLPVAEQPDGNTSTGTEAAEEDEGGNKGQSPSSLEASLGDADRAARTRPPRNARTPKRNYRTSVPALPLAALADLVALVEQWFIDLAPATLLTLSASSSSTYATAAAVAPAPPSPPPLERRHSSSPSRSPHHHRAGSSSSGHQDAAAGTSASPLVALFAALRVRLAALLESESVLAGVEVKPHVEAVLSHLATLDSSTAGPK